MLPPIVYKVANSETVDLDKNPGSVPSLDKRKTCEFRTLLPFGKAHRVLMRLFLFEKVSPFWQEIGQCRSRVFSCHRRDRSSDGEEKGYRRGPHSWGKRSLQMCVSVPGILALTSSEGEQVWSGAGACFRRATWIQESVSWSWAAQGSVSSSRLGPFPARLRDLSGGVLSKKQILLVVEGDDVRSFVCWLYQRVLIFNRSN